jgi:ribosomal-protein-alanine N-acetyltransferase
MQFVFRSLNKEDIKNIAAWHYPDPYARYNGQTLRFDLSFFLFFRPLFRLVQCEFFAVDDEHGKLVGLFQYMRLPGRTVTIGLGMRPDLTGQGLGLAFVKAGLAYGKSLYTPAFFRLDVAAFNKRAQKVYEKAGFIQVRTVKRFGRDVSHEMRYPV